ncbi:EFR1 family ferrodoxin [Anaerocolumna sp. AGMB13020]|uniref:EFR1 family ferrodoxin n=1 Tax=Anaerocolumna sp. AGMB13020 TaxID=3081750 RepID=UPI002954A33A|nr:EFR1 family ferrodoxin [Anaerocolumna sp. AGMB13020]WOO37312.1 EFR1 family ferrodoxin [Anaerocolumna sp. AGMB13020]
MDIMKPIHIAYFSGTGGTALAVETLKNTFLRKGLKVETTDVSKNLFKEMKDDFLIIIYPVYAFNAPKPMEQWLDCIPLVHKSSPAAVISVSGGGEISPNTSCRMRVIKMLEQKNYEVRYESMIVMPSNFAIAYEEVVNAMLLRALPLKVTEIVNEILSGKPCRKNPLVIDRIFSRLGLFERLFSGKIFGRNLKATDGCTGCSWCSKECPTRNISMSDKKPVFHDKCVLCMRCVYGCPHNAITPGIGKFLVLKNGYNLKKTSAHTAHLKVFPPVKNMTKGILLTGVRKYLEKYYL